MSFRSAKGYKEYITETFGAIPSSPETKILNGHIATVLETHKRNELQTIKKLLSDGVFPRGSMQPVKSAMLKLASLYCHRTIAQPIATLL